MTGLVKAVFESVCRQCHASRCSAGRCSVSLPGTPDGRVVVDLDCEPLQLSNQTRCDFLFVGEHQGKDWVALIELKGGDFKGAGVIDQLQGGADAADKWLPPNVQFQFVPVLAHGKGVHREDLKLLRSGRIRLRGQVKQVVKLHCDQALATALRS